MSAHRRSISAGPTIPNAEEIVAGNFVEINATLFWAKRMFPRTYSTATLWGRVVKVRSKNLQVHFASDDKVFPVKLSQIKSFVVAPEPPEYKSPVYEAQESDVLGSKRIPLRNSRYDDDTDSSSDGDDDTQTSVYHSKRPIVASSRPSSAATTDAATPRASPQSTGNSTTTESVQSSSASSTPRSSPKKKFDHFAEPMVFHNVEEDRFCDDDGRPYPRFGADMRLKPENWHRPMNLLQAMLPSQYLRSVVVPETSRQLLAAGKTELSEAEFQLYLGMRFAMTLHPNLPLVDFWSTTSKFLFPALNFGQFGITRRRFEEITASHWCASLLQRSIPTCGQCSCHHGIYASMKACPDGPIGRLSPTGYMCHGSRRHVGKSGTRSRARRLMFSSQLNQLSLQMSPRDLRTPFLRCPRLYFVSWSLPDCSTHLESWLATVLSRVSR
eukprot:m.923275 g.923275  ORF g.923275 m.923275 type:complete len:441 (-) comp108166_c0_seq1:895-2217(-)